MVADGFARQNPSAVLDITQPTLSKNENADRAVSDGERVLIAKALEVDILWLLGEREEKRYCPFQRQYRKKQGK